MLDQFIDMAEARGKVVYALDVPVSLNHERQERANILDALLKGDAAE